MNTSTKIFIGIAIILGLLAAAEMAMSTYFAHKYADQHGGEPASSQTR